MRYGCAKVSEQATTPDNPDDELHRADDERAPWPRLPWIDRLAIVGTLTIAAVTTVPRLPPGICYDDFGDLQLASETLGIMHPTGYSGYVTLGYLITRIPGVDPAYLVSLGCLFSGIVALWLCILMQVRLGVNAWLASAMSLVLLAHPRVWSNLVAPEVYAPSLAFLMAGAYMLIRYARLGARLDLLAAALLFGVGLANRPPILFTVPFFLIAWWLARRKWEVSWRQSATSFSLVIACAALPVLYTVGFLWFRDRPDARYNYIDQYNLQWKVLPEAEAGWRAKLERIIWHTSGKQFRKYMGSSWPRLRSKLRWLRHELLPYSYQLMLVIVELILACGLIIIFRRHKATAWLLGGLAIASVAFVCLYRINGQLVDLLPPLFTWSAQAGAAVIVVFGVIVAYRRCRVSALLLAGTSIASLVFVCAYRVHGQSANILPLLFSGIVLSGVALSVLLAGRSDLSRGVIVVGSLLIMCVVTIEDAPNRRHTGERADATSFLTELDMRTLPEHAVICTGWRSWPPLRYAQQVLTKRSDIHIINADSTHWLALSAGMGNRPVFFTRKYPPVQHLPLTPYRNLWRLERADRSGVSSSPSQSP